MQNMCIGFIENFLRDSELKKVQKVEEKPKAPKQQSSPKPKKKKKAKGFPAYMERVVEQIDVVHLNKDQVKLIGEDVTELLAYKKGYFYIRKIVLKVHLFTIKKIDTRRFLFGYSSR